jgi:hypothetical protein
MSEIALYHYFLRKEDSSFIKYERGEEGTNDVIHLASASHEAGSKLIAIKSKWQKLK